MVSSKRFSKDVDIMVEKFHTTTNAAYGCPPRDRPILEYINMGVVNIDKAIGPTSHEVTAWIRDMLGVKKAGHSGSLDPHVTGLLPVMLGKATKAISALRLSGKEYICVMHLHDDIPERKIRKACKEFTGPIYQTPPIISAVKRQLRIRNIYYLDVLEIEGRDVLMRVGCEAGTYLRKLCHDIGLVLGCGGHMKQLRRTGTGPFREDTLVSLYDLKDACVFWQEDGDESELRKLVRPMEEGLSHLPKIIIRDTAVDAVCRGASLAVPGIVSFSKCIKKDDIIAVFTLKGEAVALCKSSMDANELENESHGIACVTERVIMDAAIYPRCWKAK